MTLREFEDPLLHLLQVVVVLVEDGLHLLYIDVILGRSAPRQFDEPLYIGPEHVRFDGVGMHHLEALHLLSCLFLHLARHLRLLDLLPQVLYVVVPLVGLAKLRPYRLHLFPEKILPLAFRHLILGLGEYLCLHVQELDLLADDLGELPQPLDRIDDLEQLLGLVHLEPQVRAGDVGEFSRLVYRVEDEENVRRDHSPHGDHLLHLLPDVAHERFRLKGDLRDERLFHGLYPHKKRRPFLHIFFDLCLLRAPG